MARSQKVVAVAATATIVATGKSGKLCLFQLCSGSDAATAILKTGGSGGTVIGKIACSGGSTTANFHTNIPVHFSDGLHVTITGTTPSCSVGVMEVNPSLGTG